MKVFVTGTRGVPSIPGGVEKHCEQLYPLLVKQGVDVKLARRSSYITTKLSQWNGINLVDIFTPRKNSLEAIVHTALALFKAKRWGADIVHVHAIGPAIMVPLGRLLGMKIIVTNHGPDYDRQKWGRMAKVVLKLGEYLGCKFANEVIVISEPIREIVQQRCNRSSHLIYNGVPIPELNDNCDYIESLGLSKGGYILAVARLVPEKGFNDLMDAFESMNTDLKLVIAGDSDHVDTYSLQLKKRAKNNPNIIMPGYVMGESLSQLFTHARLFAMPSYHEGLPIALLEALSFGLPAVVSDIPANTEVKLAPECYFPVGNVALLNKTLENALDTDITASEKEETRTAVKEKYNWDDIADQTIAVYNTVLS